MNRGTLRFVKEHQKLHTIYDSMGNEMAWHYTYIYILIGCVASYFIFFSLVFFFFHCKFTNCIVSLFNIFFTFAFRSCNTIFVFPSLSRKKIRYNFVNFIRFFCIYLQQAQSQILEGQRCISTETCK